MITETQVDKRKQRNYRLAISFAILALVMLLSGFVYLSIRQSQIPKITTIVVGATLTPQRGERYPGNCVLRPANGRADTVFTAMDDDVFAKCQAYVGKRVRVVIDDISKLTEEFKIVKGFTNQPDLALYSIDLAS